MARAATPFLMLTGAAKEAMSLYVPVFRGSEIMQIDRIGPGKAGAAGSIKRAWTHTTPMHFVPSYRMKP